MQINSASYVQISSTENFSLFSYSGFKEIMENNPTRIYGVH